MTQENLNALRRGVMIDGKMTSPAEVRLIREESFSTILILTIHEGRNRQVRKMVESVGHAVVYLKRIQFGPVVLGDLPSGKWRMLTDDEISLLKEL